MSGPWQVGWSGVILAAIGFWRFWAGVKNVWPAVAAAGGDWLRRLHRAREADERGGACALPEE